MVGTMLAPTSAGVDERQQGNSRTTDGSRTGKESQLLVPFVRASRERAEPAFDESAATTTSQISVGPLDVPAYGYMAHVLLYVTGTTAGNAANVTFAADGPFNVLQDLTLHDVNGMPLVGPLSGYDLYLVNKYGAYNFLTDVKQSAIAFSATTGTGATGGSFAFIVRIPVQISGRDALGCLPNMNSSQTYKVKYSLNTTANIYGTAPTNAPTIRVRGWLEAWAPPGQVSASGVPQQATPPALGTTQYWTKTSPTISSGDQRIRMSRVGFLLRTLIVVHRTSGNARETTTNFPDPIRLELDGSLVENIGQVYFRHRMTERYGFAGAEDAAGGLDRAVYVYDWDHDLDGKPGFGQRELLLPTTQASRLEIVGNFATGGKLDIITNDIAPAAGVAA